MRSSGEHFHRDFAGCIDVMSNPYELETLTFDRSVFAKLPQMPQHMAQLEPGLRLNLIIPNLIAQVEGMYRRNIIDNWQKIARAILKQKVFDAQQVVAQLGTPVDELTVKGLMEELWFQLDFQGIALRLCYESTRDDTTIYTSPDETRTLRELSHSLQILKSRPTHTPKQTAAQDHSSNCNEQH